MPDRSVVSFDPEANVVRPELDERWRQIALGLAALKFPGLETLLPQRPTTAIACSDCGGMKPSR